MESRIGNESHYPVKYPLGNFSRRAWVSRFTEVESVSSFPGMLPLAHPKSNQASQCFGVGISSALWAGPKSLQVCLQWRKQLAMLSPGDLQ
jgi:hypothetical protein